VIVLPCVDAGLLVHWAAGSLGSWFGCVRLPVFLWDEVPVGLE